MARANVVRTNSTNDDVGPVTRLKIVEGGADCLRSRRPSTPACENKQRRRPA